MKKTKIIKRIFSVVWWVLVILLVMLLINVIGAKMRGKVPNIFGYSIMQIISGSMEDTIKTGEYILVKGVRPEDVGIDDIISFYSDEREIYGLPNTHRVVDIMKTDNGLEYVTRGDANSANDTVNARAERLIGVYVGTLTFLGDFSDFLNNGGMFAIVTVLWVSTFAMIGFSMFKKLKEQSSSEQDSSGSES